MKAESTSVPMAKSKKAVISNYHPIIRPTNHVVENSRLCYYFVMYVMGGWITVHNCYKYSNFDGR